MAQLALDDVHRYALTGELHGVGVAQLVGHAGRRGELAQFGAGGGGCPASPAGGAVYDAEQRAGRQQHAHSEPRGKLLKAELVHSGFAALVALAVADTQRAAALVDVGLVERQWLGDPQPRPPEHGDQRSDP